MVRLSGERQFRAVRLVAPFYLLRVLAPTLSFALPGSQAVSPCRADAESVLGVVHVHAASYVHGDEHMHDPAMARSYVGAPARAASVEAPAPPERRRLLQNRLLQRGLTRLAENAAV